MDLEFTKEIRLVEINNALSRLGKEFFVGRSVLEIGAGSGWQAKLLNELGCIIQAIDIDTSKYKNNRVWPITYYNGKIIPFPDKSFDIVFSSNVMEHIPNLDDFQSEISRVLKDDGKVIHIVPSASWRFWTNFSHYVFVLTSLLKKISFRYFTNKPDSAGAPINGQKHHSLVNIIRHALFPHKHGAKGNALTELWYFSRWSWNNLFNRTGWLIEKRVPVELLYSGYLSFERVLSISARARLSQLFGSSTHLYVLSKNQK